MAGLDPAIEKTMLDAQPQNPAFCGLAHRRSGKKRITCQLCLADVRLLAAARQGLGRPMIIKPIEFISGNKLLNALAASALERLDPHIERIEAGLGAVICEAGGMLHHAYFPETSVLSLLTVPKNGAAIETANIGREGLFGLAFVMYKPSHGCFKLHRPAAGELHSRSGFDFTAGIREQCADPRSVRELHGGAVGANSADRRVQCGPQRAAKGLPLAFDHARPGERR